MKCAFQLLRRPKSAIFQIQGLGLWEAKKFHPRGLTATKKLVVIIHKWDLVHGHQNRDNIESNSSVPGNQGSKENSPHQENLIVSVA